MATRLQLRTYLRRRLQEQAADHWDDPELDGLLDLGTHRMQLFLMAFAPDVLIYISKANLSANDELVELPEGVWTIKMVQILNSASGKYERIRSKGYEELVARNQGSPSTTSTEYARLAEWLYLSPTPTADVTDGVRIHYVPSHSMTSDTDIPKVPLLTHMGVVLQANVYALPEVGDEVEAVQRDLNEMRRDIQAGWWSSLDEGLVLRPDIRKRPY